MRILCVKIVNSIYCNTLSIHDKQEVEIKKKTERVRDRMKTIKIPDMATVQGATFTHT